MVNRIKYFGVLILSFFISCSSTKNEITIGVLFDSFNALRFQKEKLYFEEKITQLGGKAIIKSAGGNELKQKLLAKELVDQEVDVLIIIATNVNTAAAMVRYAHANNVKVIAYDRLIKNCDLDYYVSFDGNKVGELLAEYAVEKVPEGNYVLMNGDASDDNSSIFYNGTAKIIQPFIDSGKINVIYKGFNDRWSSAESEFTMNKILELSSKKIDVVLSQYDGLSRGVIKALKEKGLEKQVIVTGQDAEIDACKRILDGTQSMTIYKPVKKLAHECVELAFNILNSGKVEGSTKIDNGRTEVPTFLLEPIVVDRNNIEATVIKDEFLLKGQIMSGTEMK